MLKKKTIFNYDHKKRESFEVKIKVTLWLIHFISFQMIISSNLNEKNNINEQNKKLKRFAFKNIGNIFVNKCI